MVFGIAAWRGLGIHFTDGLCRRCADHVRAEEGVEAGRRGRLALLRPAFASLGACAVVLLPHSLDYLPPRLGPIRAASTVPAAAADEPGAEPVSLNDPADSNTPVLSLSASVPNPLEGPVAQTPAQRAGRMATAPLLEPLPSRAEIRFYDDPASPRALFSVQTP